MNILFRISFILYVTFNVTIWLILFLPNTILSIIAGLLFYILTGDSQEDKLLSDEIRFFPMEQMKVYEYSVWVDKKCKN